MKPSGAGTGRRVAIGIVVLLLVLIGALVLFFALTNAPPGQSPEEAGEGELGQSAKALDIRFNQPSVLREWREHVFNGKSEYKIAPDEHGEAVLSASSRNTDSAIFKIMNVSKASRPVLSWEWRVVTFPSGKKHTGLGAAGENDFAIRVCAVFAKNNPFKTEVIQYVWDDYFPEGTHDKGPYSESTRILVVQSGPPPASPDWVVEQRDVMKDYELLFGKPPSGNLRAVSIFSSSEETHTQSKAYLRRLWIARQVAEKSTGEWTMGLGPRVGRLGTGVTDLFRRLKIPFGKMNPLPLGKKLKERV